jgi:methionyl-tRNA formyltransferase
MTPDLKTALNPPDAETSNWLSSIDILNAMIELRIQLREIEEQIQALQPAFFVACLALNTDKIALQRATISRRLTPGQWAYSANVVEQEDLLKQLKQQFQKTHEPVGGREITWAIKLLLITA